LKDGILKMSGRCKWKSCIYKPKIDWWR